MSPVRVSRVDRGGLDERRREGVETGMRVVRGERGSSRQIGRAS